MKHFFFKSQKVAMTDYYGIKYPLSDVIYYYYYYYYFIIILLVPVVAILLLGVLTW